MVWRRFATFKGGIVLPEEKRSTRSRSIVAPKAAANLLIPLDVCGLGNVRPLVEAGQMVSAGQQIALAGKRVPVFSPTDGIIAGAAAAMLAGQGGAKQSPALEIVPSQGAAGKLAAPQAAAADRSRAADGDAIIQRIAEGGLFTFGRSVLPLADWLAAARSAKVDTIIANGLENEPFLTGECRILREHGAAIVEALAIIARAIGAARQALAVDAQCSRYYANAAQAAEAAGIEALAIEPKYPVGHPVLLTHIIARRAVPPGGEPVDVRTAVLNVATLFAISRWLSTSTPPTHRVITIAGKGVGESGNYLLPLGTPVSAALEIAGFDPASPASLWCGGPLTGAQGELSQVIGPATSAILALEGAGQAAASVCIRCGWCTDQCPVQLNVAELNDLFELGQVAPAGEYDVQACIGCGVCSYICPACIPLTHRVSRLKAAAAQL